MPEQLTRRKALGALGAVSVGALLAACGASDDPVTSTDVTTSDGATATVQPRTGSATTVEDLFAEAATCTLTPEETEGPYYFDVDAVRSDIREDRDGTDLRVAIRVQDAAACTPIANAVVDIWHCDAGGIYSGFESASTGGPGGSGPTDDDTFLRGVQVTNAKGIAEFLTIYPGWYRGRTVHIHAKVHIDSATALTTQMYFDEAVTDAVYANDPYTEHTGRDTFNDKDGIFEDGLIVTLAEDGDGYVSVMTFGVDAA
jgi:protocatechuate 3,4-dioxygenase beta subunit